MKFLKFYIMSITLAYSAINIEASEYIKEKLNDAEEFFQTSKNPIIQDIRSATNSIRNEAKKINARFKISEKLDAAGKTISQEAKEFGQAAYDDIVALEKYISEKFQEKKSQSISDKNLESIKPIPYINPTQVSGMQSIKDMRVARHGGVIKRPIQPKDIEEEKNVAVQ